MNEVGCDGAQEECAHGAGGNSEPFAAGNDGTKADQVDKHERSCDRVEVNDAPPSHVLERSHMHVGEVLMVVGETFRLQALLGAAHADKVADKGAERKEWPGKGERMERVLPEGKGERCHDKEKERGHPKPGTGKVVAHGVLDDDQVREKDCQEGDDQRDRGGQYERRRIHGPMVADFGRPQLAI